MVNISNFSSISGFKNEAKNLSNNLQFLLFPPFASDAANVLHFWVFCFASLIFNKNLLTAFSWNAWKWAFSCFWFAMMQTISHFNNKKELSAPKWCVHLWDAVGTKHLFLLFIIFSMFKGFNEEPVSCLKDLNISLVSCVWLCGLKSVQVQCN